MNTYTKSEMLAVWRRALGLENSRCDCSIESVEGLEVDKIISGLMRRWYLDILDKAEVAYCPVTNAARQGSLSQAGLFGLIALPKGTRRVLSVKMSHWLKDAPVMLPAEHDCRIRRMASPFGRPGCNDPMAMLDPRGVLVCPADAGSTIEILMVIADPGEELYILDEVLLSTIPKSMPVMHEYDGGSCL